MRPLRVQLSSSGELRDRKMRRAGIRYMHYVRICVGFGRGRFQTASALTSIPGETYPRTLMSTFNIHTYTRTRMHIRRVLLPIVVISSLAAGHEAPENSDAWDSRVCGALHFCSSLSYMLSFFYIESVCDFDFCLSFIGSHLEAAAHLYSERVEIPGYTCVCVFVYYSLMYVHMYTCLHACMPVCVCVHTDT